jgi:uncharacterized protein (TIRG00374 family)
VAGRIALLVGLLFGLAGVTVYFFTVRIDIPNLNAYSPLVITGAIGLGVLTTLAHVVSARVLLWGVPWSRALPNLYLVVTASLAANYLTSAVVGLPIRVYLYNRVLRVNTATGTAMTAAETVFSTATRAIIGLAAIGILWREVNALFLVASLVLLAAAVAIFLGLRADGAKALLQRLPRPRWARRGVDFLVQLQESVGDLDRRAIGAAIVIYAVMLVLDGLRLFLLLEMVGAGESMIYLTSVQGLALTAGALSFIPMGIGVRDATLLGLLLGLGVDRDAAIAVTVTERLLTTGLRFALGLVSAQVLGFKVLFAGDSAAVEEQPSAEVPVVEGGEG